MDEPEDYVQVSTALGNLHIKPLPETHIPVEAIILIKSIDEDGDTSWFTRYTWCLTEIETLGAIAAVHELLKREVLNSYIPYTEEED